MNSQLFVHDRESNQQYVLYESPPYSTHVHPPFLYDEYIGWIKREDELAYIMLHHIPSQHTHTVAELNSHNFFSNFVHIDDGKLLWTDSAGGQGYYHIYDIVHNETRTYESEREYPGYAKMVNDQIFSLQFHDHRDWIGNVLMVYNTQRDEHRQLSSSYANYLQVWNNILEYTDSEEGFLLFFVDNDLETEEISIELDFLDASVNFEFMDSGHLVIKQFHLEEPQVEISIVTFD